MIGELPGPPRGTLADVLPALLRALGEPAPDLRRDGPQLAPARAAGLLLIDGLGAQLLDEHAADAPFLAALPDAGPLRTGFPSSTSISVASLGTGLPPGGTAWSGSRSGPAPGDCWTPCTGPPTTPAGPGTCACASHPSALQPEPTMFERAAAAGSRCAWCRRRHSPTPG